MIDPQNIYYCKDIIIPVIGYNCFTYNSGGNEIPFQEFIVNTLTKGIELETDDLDKMKTRGYYGLTLLKKRCYSNKENKFKLEYRRAVENNKRNIHLNQSIKSFLQAYKFPVIITTSCFKFIEEEEGLNYYKSVSYPSVDGNQNKLDENGNTVYHIFGLEAPGAKWVTGEEDLLHFVHNLHGDGATDLKKYIMADNRKKALFVIGSSLPDWLFRFFLYPMTDINTNEEGFFLNSTNNIEDSLAIFLDTISYEYMYDVDQNLESVLQDATKLCPSSDTPLTHRNRVSHPKEYDIFISYASENREQAESIRDILQNNYNLKVWLDQKIIVDGDYGKRIIQGIENSAYFMPIVTKEYIRKHMPYPKSYNSIDDIVNDDKLQFLQKETLVAELLQKKMNRISYSLPIVVQSDIGENGTLDIDMIENNFTKSCTLPENLFKRQHISYYNEMFDGERDWSIYHTIEEV